MRVFSSLGPPASTYRCEADRALLDQSLDRSVAGAAIFSRVAVMDHRFDANGSRVDRRLHLRITDGTTDADIHFVFLAD